MATAIIGRQRGRPSKGVNKYCQVCLYLPPEVLEALDRLVEMQTQRTGRHTNRTDVIREAIQQHLLAALPPPTTVGQRQPARRSTTS